MTARPKPRLCVPRMTWNLMSAHGHPAPAAGSDPITKNVVQSRTGPHKNGKGQA